MSEDTANSREYVQYLRDEIARLNWELGQLRARLSNPANPDTLNTLAGLTDHPHLASRLRDWAVLEKKRLEWAKEASCGTKTEGPPQAPGGP